jgi:hypothetical protein
MADVMTFWWHPDEEAAFLDFLESEKTPLAVPWDKVLSRELLVPVPVRNVLGNNLSSVFLLDSQHAEKLVISFFEDPDGGYYRVSDMESCVVGYDRARFLADGSLMTANLYFYRRYPNATADALVEKPAEFIKWAKKVMGWVGKATPRKVRDRRGSERIALAVDHGLVQLAPY